MIDPLTGIDFPMFQSQLNDIFGTPNEGQFARDYLRNLDFSEFAGDFGHVVDYEGNPWGHKIYGNFALEGPLRRAFGFLVERGLAGELRTYDGCFNIRKMKGGSGYSVHSWGLAVDLNAGSNAFGDEPSLSPEFVKCFAESGFEWGGLWVPDSVRDGMHFQLPWIKVRSGPLAPVAWEA
jgi:hypothetical protein